MKITTTKEVTSQKTTEVEIPDNNLYAAKFDELHKCHTIIDDMHIEIIIDEKEETVTFKVQPASKAHAYDIEKLQSGIVETDTLDLVQKSLHTFTAMFEAAVQKHVKANQKS